MRIILTAEGEKMINELSQEKEAKHQPRYHPTEYIFKSRNIPHKSIPLKSKVKRQVRLFNTHTLNKEVQIKRDLIAISADSLMAKPKIINVKVSKVIFPKGGAEKYEATPYQKSHYITEDNMNSNYNQTDTSFPILNSMNSELTYSSNLKGNYSLKDILGEDTALHLKKKLIKDKRESDESKVLRPTLEYRTRYQSKSDLVQFNEVLSRNKIPFNKTDLVKYLHTHKNQAKSILLRKIGQANPSGLNQLNRICQMTLSKEGKDKEVQTCINKKLKEKESEVKTQYHNALIQMKSNMKHVKYTLDYYPNRSYSREISQENYQDMKKTFWKNHDIDRLYKKSFKSVKVDNKG